MNDSRGSETTNVRLRMQLLAILVLGLLGTAAELLLAAHTETLWQWTPLVLIGLALLNSIWILASSGAAAIHSWRLLMVLFILSGFTGLYLHGQAKVEFKKEADPSLGGPRLLWEAMRSISPPALAPGFMIQAGLIGLLFTWRHPALNPDASRTLKTTGEEK